eukprot:scaffold17388_cov110-Isochrysis_galbana.AAC.1
MPRAAGRAIRVRGGPGTRAPGTGNRAPGTGHREPAGQWRRPVDSRVRGLGLGGRPCGPRGDEGGG